MLKKFLLCLLASSILCACQEKQNKKEVAKKIDYYNLPTFSKNDALQAIVEIPAGTNHKIEYHPEEKKFQVDSTDGKPRIINFLPYFGNYGFVPSTFSDPKKGGDGDALDIFILSETEPSGSVLEVIPIALVRLIDEGESDYKIIAIPYDKSKRIIDAENFDDLSLNYPEIRKMINTWLLHYDPNDKIVIKSWGGEIAAQKEIERWQK